MKRILLILIAVTVSVFAKPCMTDIYFGNGVHNTEDQAKEKMTELKKLMQKRAITPLSIEDEKNQLYSFKYAYNPTRGSVDDLAETYWQLYESGQISEGYFASIYLALAGGAGSGNDEFLEKLRTIISIYNDDANAMYQLYNNASFSKKHNVLLVAHSQGNLFGNKMYTLMNDAQKKKFRMVSVATPADHVAGGGPYVTVVGDYVINAIPNALSGNVDGVGHTFVGTYLNDSINAPRKIALYIKSAYDDLMQTATCTEYSFTRVWMRSYGLLNVYGNADGRDELIATVALTKSDAIWDDKEQKYKCDPMESSSYWGDDNYVGYNWTSNYEDGRNNSWIPGEYISSRSKLDDRSDINETVRKEDQCVTISLSQGSELYSIIANIFPE